MTDTPTSPPPAAPPPAPTPEQRLAEIFASPAFNSVTHPLHDATVAELLQLQRSIDGEAGARATAHVLDGNDSALSTVHNSPVPEKMPLRELYPDLSGGRAWDEALLTGLEEAAATHGVTESLPYVLHTLEEEARRGESWDEDASGAWLAETYGEAEADRLIADAQRAGAALPEPVKQWLRATGMVSNPKLLVAVAGLYRQRRQP